jgi:hypothetical protein
MKLRDHVKEVKRLQENHARQVQQLQRVSARRLLQYMSDDTLQRITDDLDRMQDLGAFPLIQLVDEVQAQRMDREPKSWRSEPA